MVSNEDRIAQHYARWEKRNRKASGLRRRGEEEKARRAAERQRRQPEEEPIVLDGGGVLDTSALPDVPTPEEMDAYLGESHGIYYGDTPGFD